MKACPVHGCEMLDNASAFQTATGLSGQWLARGKRKASTLTRIRLDGWFPEMSDPVLRGPLSLRRKRRGMLIAQIFGL